MSKTRSRHSRPARCPQPTRPPGRSTAVRANQAVVKDAREVAKKGGLLRVDVTDLAEKLKLHDPPADGKVPDNHARLASIGALGTAAAEAKKKFDLPERCAKRAALATAARSAIVDADETLDGDKDHPRDSDYWQHLRLYQDRTKTALTTYDTQLKEPFPDWAKIDKALDSMALWTPHVKLERTQGDAHVDKRVGTNGVAVAMTTIPALQGDGQGEIGSIWSEKTALRETLKAIDDSRKWKGAGKWAEYYGNGGGDLPAGSYLEYYVRAPSKNDGNGLRRVVVDEDGRRWYSWTHYGEKGKPAFVLLKGYGGV